jgi:hypothetical protein
MMAPKLFRYFLPAIVGFQACQRQSAAPQARATEPPEPSVARVEPAAITSIPGVVVTLVAHSLSVSTGWANDGRPVRSKVCVIPFTVEPRILYNDLLERLYRGELEELCRGSKNKIEIPGKNVPVLLPRSDERFDYLDIVSSCEILYGAGHRKGEAHPDPRRPIPGVASTIGRGNRRNVPLTDQSQDSGSADGCLLLAFSDPYTASYTLDLRIKDLEWLFSQGRRVSSTGVGIGVYGAGDWQQNNYWVIILPDPSGRGFLALPPLKAREIPQWVS